MKRGEVLGLDHRAPCRGQSRDYAGGDHSSVRASEAVQRRQSAAARDRQSARYSQRVGQEPPDPSGKVCYATFLAWVGLGCVRFMFAPRV